MQKGQFPLPFYGYCPLISHNYRNTHKPMHTFSFSSIGTSHSTSSVPQETQNKDYCVIWKHHKNTKTWQGNPQRGWANLRWWGKCYWCLLISVFAHRQSSGRSIDTANKTDMTPGRFLNVCKDPVSWKKYKGIKDTFPFRMFLLYLHLSK